MVDKVSGAGYVECVWEGVNWLILWLKDLASL